MVKHAIKSTEFYVTCFGILLCGVNLFWVVGIQNETINTAVSIAGIVALAGIYVIGRAMVKANVK